MSNNSVGPVLGPENFQLQPSSQQGDEEEDVLDRILENYNYKFEPEVRVKFKQQIKSCSVCAAVATPWQCLTGFGRETQRHRPRLRITIKPDGQTAVAGLLHKVLLVPTHSQACLFSKKLQLGWLRLQFMAGYNWARKRPTLDYRVTTKWSEGGRMKRKERYQVADSMLLRCHWRLDLRLPDMEGHFGVDEQEWEPMDVDYGSMLFEISQVDMVLQSPLWRPRVPALAARGASAAGADHVSAGLDEAEEGWEEGRGMAHKAGPSGGVAGLRPEASQPLPSEAGPRPWWHRSRSGGSPTVHGAGSDSRREGGGSRGRCPIDSAPSHAGGPLAAEQRRQQDDRVVEGGSSRCTGIRGGPESAPAEQPRGQPLADWLTALKAVFGGQRS